jgi:heat shock protein HslJ
MEATMINMRKTLVVALVLAATLSVIGGCAHRSGANPGSSPPGSSPSRSPLEGTQWRLSEWTVSSIDPASVTIWANFAGGQISGSSGVNSYGGPYKTGPGDAFSTGQLAVTAIGGTGPAMRAESAYLTLLSQGRSYRVSGDGDTLTLYDAAGNESLIFVSVVK